MSEQQAPIRVEPPAGGWWKHHRDYLPPRAYLSCHQPTDAMRLALRAELRAHYARRNLRSATGDGARRVAYRLLKELRLIGASHAV